MNKFKVGDIARCTYPYDWNDIIVNKYGKIVRISPGYTWATVEFFENVGGNGYCGKDGYYWDVELQYLELANITVDSEKVNSFLY